MMRRLLWCALGYLGDLLDTGIPAQSVTRADGVYGRMESDGPDAADVTPPLSWVEWATPAICDVLAVHVLMDNGRCAHGRGDGPALDVYAWREHVSPLIAARLETATLAMATAHAADLFPQHRRT